MTRAVHAGSQQDRALRVVQSFGRSRFTWIELLARLDPDVTPSAARSVLDQLLTAEDVRVHKDGELRVYEYVGGDSTRKALIRRRWNRRLFDAPIF